jgi:hypothetical protein
LEFSFELSLDDMAAYQRMAVLRSSTYRRSVWANRLMMPVIAVVVLAYAVVANARYLPFAGLMAVMALIWFALLPSWQHRRLRRVIDRLLSEKGNGGILGTHTVRVTDHEIICEHPSGRTNTTWSSIIDSAEDERLLLLYTSSVSALVFPKAAIEASIIGALRVRAASVITNGSPPASDDPTETAPSAGPGSRT